jgi:nucleotide-binding universal stress UspA family protein
LDSLLKIHKILVPVDYSEYSVLASRYALKIAQKADAEIRFFHSFYSPAYDLIDLTGNKNTQQKLRKDVTDKLMVGEAENMNNFLSSLNKYVSSSGLPKKKISYEIRPGLAKEEIQKIAGEYQPSIVIMGTRGKDKKENSILGSITEIVVRKLKYPVLAVPENYEFVGLENLNKIVYITDFDESDFLSIKKLMEFTNLMGLTIHCLHIGSKSDKWDRIKMDGLKDYFLKSYNEPKVECDILPSEMNVLNAINNYIKEKKINLISLTSKKRNVYEKIFKPNLTKRLFYHSNIPLLVFHI